MYFAFAFLIAIAGVVLHSGHADPPSDKIITRCKAWVPNEGCCSWNFKKYENRYDFDEHTRCISKHVYHDRPLMPAACDDGVNAWFAKCPKNPLAKFDCSNLHSTNNIAELDVCRKSCGLCDTSDEAIMSTQRHLTPLVKEEPHKCLKLSKKCPYNCLDYKMTGGQVLPSIIFTTYKFSDADCDPLSAPDTTLWYYMYFKFRRRAPSEMLLDSMTTCKACLQVTNDTYDFTHTDLLPAKPTCDDGTIVELDDATNLGLNKWLRVVVLYGVSDDEDCKKERRFILSCESGVDTVDIDDFVVVKGDQPMAHNTTDLMEHLQVNVYEEETD